MPSKAVPGPFNHPATLLTGNCQTLLSFPLQPGCESCSPCGDNSIADALGDGKIPALQPEQATTWSGGQ